MLLACAVLVGCTADDGGPYVLVNARDAPYHVDIGPRPWCSAGCALVHVDGFDNSLDEARANFSAVSGAYRRAGGVCEVLGFAWRSDGGVRRFRDGERLADEVAAPSLAAFLRRLEPECGVVHLVGHSLAARVILGALEAGPEVASVSLLAPAVFDDALDSDGEFPHAAAHAGRMFVFFNSQDWLVLGAMFPMASRKARLPLGLQGSRRAVPPSVTEVDFAPMWGPVHSLRKSIGPALWTYLLPRLHGL